MNQTEYMQIWVENQSRKMHDNATYTALDLGSRGVFLFDYDIILCLHKEHADFDV